MEEIRAAVLVKKLQTSLEQAAREEYELFFLRDLLGNRLEDLVFKKGTVFKTGLWFASAKNFSKIVQQKARESI